MPARLLTAILFATLFALPAQAIRLDIVQTGGTAIGGAGGAGDTLILEVVATLEAGEATPLVGATLQWDLEGGDVLRLVSASEPQYQLVNDITLSPISPSSRIGNPFGDLSMSVAFDIDEPVYPSIAGPEYFFGLEQIPPIGTMLPGPATFTIGTLEFVLNDAGSTEISFLTESPVRTVIGDADYQDVTPISDLDTFQVSSVGLTPTPVPEPGTGVLLSLGLVGIAAAGRRRMR